MICDNTSQAQFLSKKSKRRLCHLYYVNFEALPVRFGLGNVANKAKKIELNWWILCENMMLRWSSSTDISLKKPINAKLKNLLSTVIYSNREFVYRFILNLLISQFGKVRTLFCFWLSRFWKNSTEILPFTMSLWRKDDITCQENYIKLIALQFSASQPNFILIC